MKRRTILTSGVSAVSIGALGGAGALLAACSSSSSSSSNFQSTGSVPRPGGHLRIGTEAEENGLSPFTSNFDATGIMYARAFYDPLAATDSTGKTHPYLARSITPNYDFTKWTIEVRSNVYFHDGSPLDSDALVLNFSEHLKSPLSGPVLGPIIKAINKVDPLTIELSMNSPWVPFDVYLCGWIGGQFAYVSSPKAIQAGTLNTNPVGTGPFVFSQWEPNDHLSGTKNPHYWQTGLPYVDSVTFHPLPVEQSRSDSLRAGDVDVAHFTDVPTYNALKTNSSFTHVDNIAGEVGPADQDFIMLDLAKPPMDNLNFRRALASSLDVVSYNKAVNLGLTQIDRSVFQVGSPYHSVGSYPNYSPKSAREYLKMAGLSSNQSSFVLANVTGPNNQVDLELVGEMLSRVSINTSQQQIEQSKYIINALLGDFDAYFWRQFGAIDPDQNYNWWSSAFVKPVGTISLNFARNSDPVIDKALLQGRENPQVEARVEAYKTVARQINQDIPYLWQNRALWAVCARGGVHGYDSYRLPDGADGLGLKSGIFPIVGVWLS